MMLTQFSENRIHNVKMHLPTFKDLSSYFAIYSCDEYSLENIF